jgi:hypothetical protein
VIKEATVDKDVVEIFMIKIINREIYSEDISGDKQQSTDVSVLRRKIYGDHNPTQRLVLEDISGDQTAVDKDCWWNIYDGDD